MNQDDFRCMRRGKQLALLDKENSLYLKGFSQRGPHKKTALLLLHGFSSSPAVFRYFYPHLDHYDAIIAPTLPGHGTDLNDFSKIKAYDWISFVKHQCRLLCRNYQKVDVLGLSLGGLLACHLSNHFKLNHLYLLAPAIKLRLHLPLILPLVKLFQGLGFARLRANAGNVVNHVHCEIAYRQLPLSTIIEVLQLIKQFEFFKPSCPTELFLGKQDAIINCTEVAQRFSHARNINIHWLKHSAHILPLDNDIELILSVISQARPK